MAALVVALLWVHRSQRWPLEWIVKPSAAATFIVASLASGALSSTWGTIMFVGFILAAGGDVLLIPKGAKLSFLGGLCSFLLGHVAYAVAFAVRGLDWVWAGLTLAICIAVGIPILRWLWPHVETKMRIPVAAYILVITSMVALAAGTHGARPNIALVIGAVGFYLSDISVAKDRFVGASFANRAWGLPLYFFSQLILATAVGEAAS